MNVDGEVKFKIWITGSTIWTRINRLIRSTKIYPVHFHPWQCHRVGEYIVSFFFVVVQYAGTILDAVRYSRNWKIAQSKLGHPHDGAPCSTH